MMPKLPHKLKQFVSATIKVCVVIFLSYTIYTRLLQNETLSWQDFTETFLSLELSFFSVLFILALTLGNWVFEIKKWQILTRTVKKISFKESAKQALASQTTTLFTPVRAGEYGIKVLYFEARERKQILKLNFLGNICQLFVTLVFGFIGILVLIKTLKPDLFWISVFITLLFVAILFLVLKFNLKAITVYNGLQTKLSSKVVLLSVIRYVFFSSQFYYLLMLFGIDLGIVITMSIITTTYLISSMVPVLSIFDVVLKGGVAVYIFGLFQVYALPVLCVSTLMWLLNAVFPSIVGSVFLLTSKFKLKPITKPILQDA